MWQHHNPDYAMNQYAEIIVFFLVGTVTGVLADKGMKQRSELAGLNRELHDSFEQIKRADRLSAIGQLSASLAHEIRNPLASIDGATNLIESEQTPPDMRSAALAGHSAEQKGITIRKDVTATVPAFECDPEQLKQVILNLTINAVQAMTGT